MVDRSVRYQCQQKRQEASSTLVDKLQWEVLDDLGGSDHYPTITTYGRRPYAIQTNRDEAAPIQWNLKEANWAAYETKIDRQIDVGFPVEVDSITEAIIKAANASIPVRNTQPNGRCRTHWWKPYLKEPIIKKVA